MSNFHKILLILLSLIYGSRKGFQNLGKLNRTLHEVLCGRSFIKKSKLVWHMLNHTGTKPFVEIIYK